MATFCLIHGNWHDGSCWQALIDSLEARGHDAIAPDLPFDESGLGYALRAQPAMEAIAGIDGPVVVVGHSVSSAEAALVASEHPEALLVHLCPRMGPFAPIDAPPAFRPGFSFPPSRPDGTVVWDEDAAIDAMYPRLTPERGRALAKGLRPGAAPVGDYPLAGHPANRSVLVYTTHDEFFEPEFERFMALKLGAESIELPGGHFPMDENPEGLAELLDRLAREHVHPDAVA